MEDGEQLPFEIARYVSPDSTGFMDPVFEIYHGATSLDMAALMQPGADEVHLQAKSFQKAPNEENGQPHSLLKPPPENNK